MRVVLNLSLVFGLVFSMPIVANAGPVIIKDFKRSKTSWFYNKPGATLEDVNRDEYDCTAFGHEMFTMKPFNDGDPYFEHSGIVGSVMGGTISSGPIRGSKDDCMMSLGYRRFNPGDASLKEFQKRYNVLTDAEKNKYHGDVTPPEGTLVRQWVNTFWITTDDEPKADIETRNYMPIRNKNFEPFQPWPKKLKSLESNPGIVEGADEAIIIAKILSTDNKKGIARFMRVDSSTGEAHPLEGKKGKLPTITLSTKNKKMGDYAVFKVPSGTYALGGIDFHAMCMQTVAFKASRGSVIYLGEYTGRKNEQQVHPLAPTPRARFRFDKGNAAVAAEALGLSQVPVDVKFHNNFPYQCPASIGEKMYGVSMPGQPSFQNNW
ncbi:MAG: hypothetical protein ABJN69_03830 [Hellea sp.]